LAEDKPALRPIAIRSETDTEAKPHSDLLTIFNRPIIILRDNLYGFGPSDRVRAIKQRISDLVAEGKTKSLTTRPTAEGTVIELDGEWVMLITPGMSIRSRRHIRGYRPDNAASTPTRSKFHAKQYNVGYLLRASVTLVARWSMGRSSGLPGGQKFDCGY